jgi:nicotinamidase-related amidase
MNRRRFAMAVPGLVKAVDSALGQAAPGRLVSEPKPFVLRARKIENGQPSTATMPIDPRKIGVVVVDMWNHHWCMTAAHRVHALVPRMNRALAGARRLGMSVMWAPTDVASQYAGSPQRERSLALPRVPVPKLADLVCPLTAKEGKCMCGPGLACIVNYGWDGMDPGLRIGANDPIVSGFDEVYANCRERGITHLVYAGVHLNACVMGKPEALKYAFAAGLKAVFARDITDAITHYDPDANYTPDDGTAQTVADLERCGIASVDFAQAIREAGAWGEDELVDLVRIAPWGTNERPYLFTDAVTVTLTAPQIGGADLRYTLDGSEPKASSPVCRSAMRLRESVRIRAAAFRGDRKVSPVSEGEFVRLGALPPSPGVPLHELKPVESHRKGWSWPVKTGESFCGGPLTIRGRTYAAGIGMRAPANAAYEVRQEWDRFVALAGVDDDVYRRTDHGRFLARHARVQFKVFIDGRLAAQSPVMWVSQEPWRFEVVLPKGSRLINLVASPAGAASEVDLADWVEAGFVSEAGSTVREMKRDTVSKT